MMYAIIVLSLIKQRNSMSNANWKKEINQEKQIKLKYNSKRLLQKIQVKTENVNQCRFITFLVGNILAHSKEGNYVKQYLVI